MNLHADKGAAAAPVEVERHEAEPVMSAKIRRPLYEARKKIFPKRAEGRFRQFKWLVMLVTLGIFAITQREFLNMLARKRRHPENPNA